MHANLLQAIVGTPWLFPVLLVVELVLALSGWIDKLTVTRARAGFIAYAALTGVILSIVLRLFGRRR
jgi:FtsH-binding integral membrane protein